LLVKKDDIQIDASTTTKEHIMNITANTNAIATQLVNTDLTTRQMTTDPVKTIVSQDIAAKTVDVNAAAIKTIDAMHGSLLDIKG